MTSRPPTVFAWLSVGTSLLTIILKFSAYYLTGSMSLFSDAVESLVNIVAALVALGVLTYSAAKPDRKHNFGHEKAQYFSSGIEGVLIVVAAGAIIWSTVPRIMNPPPIEQVGWGIILSVVASLANLGCAWVMLRAARVHRSITLEADAQHLLTDVITTAGVVLGLILVTLTGWTYLDPLIAIAVALQILRTGIQLLLRSFHGLMDVAIPDDEHEKVIAVLEALRARGCDYHALRTRVSGARSFVDVHILVPGNLSVQQGHDLCEEVEKEMRIQLSHLEVITHLEPIEDPRAWQDVHLGRMSW